MRGHNVRLPREEKGGKAEHSVKHRRRGGGGGGGGERKEQANEETVQGHHVFEPVDRAQDSHDNSTASSSACSSPSAGCQRSASSPTHPLSSSMGHAEAGKQCVCGAAASQPHRTNPQQRWWCDQVTAAHGAAKGSTRAASPPCDKHPSNKGAKLSPSISPSCSSSPNHRCRVQQQ